jgi:hypothetical protein
MMRMPVCQEDFALNQYTHVMTVLRIHLHRLSPVFIVPPAGVHGGNFPSDNSPTGRDGILRIDESANVKLARKQRVSPTLHLQFPSRGGS